MQFEPAPRTKRRIAVLSTSRADYSHLFWVLKELQQANDVDLRIIVSGAHLAPTFGASVGLFGTHGFCIEAAVEALLDSDSDVGMAKTTGVAMLGLADVLGRLRPDLLLLIADRYEMLAPAATALALRIPIAHIEGGEVSEGAIDDAVRNALTKLSHIHFVSTATARRRVMAMGEASWRVHHAGAPSLDHLRRSNLPNRADLEARLGVALTPAPCVVSFHPVTLHADTSAEAFELFAALARIDLPIVFCFPNADAGHQAIIEMARAHCRRDAAARLFINLDPLDYWALLKHAALIVGNSSSGIMESPSLALPCVNVGMRQRGRERAANVVDCAADRDAIVAAIRTAVSDTFARGIKDLANPYGDGDSARRIVRVLREVPLGASLLVKTALPLTPSGPPAFLNE
ncbi:MAG: UDP-N-acetylglucosamine 2-epimerase [Xanthomonadaceae bacterium]|nr:UDP-N-acetylglucosamine 2-epimerase [Xanthomonadaceae bacterium]